MDDKTNPPKENKISSKPNNKEHTLLLPNYNNFSLPLLGYTFSQSLYRQINQDFLQSNLTFQNVGGGVPNFRSIMLPSSKQRSNEQVYQCDNEYNKATYNDNSSLLEFKLSDKVFDYYLFIFIFLI